MRNTESKKNEKRPAYSRYSKMLGFYNPFPNLVPKNKVPHKLHFYFLTFFTQTSLATELDLIPSQLHSEIAAPYTIVQNPRGMCNLPEHR